MIVPWFAFAHVRFGSELWETILGYHVFVRFTDSLDPTHLPPWHFYLTTLWRWLVASGSHLLVSIGLALLTFRAAQRRWLEGTAVVVWFTLPTLLISLGTSKLYHYLYPFLPPLALAGGYLAAFAATVASGLLDRALQGLDRAAGAHVPVLLYLRRRTAIRVICAGAVLLAALVAAVTVAYKPVRLTVGETVVFRNSGTLRPIVAVALFGIVAGNFRHTGRIVVALVVASVLPLQPYRRALPQLTVERHPMRTASECLTRIAPPAGTPAGLYLDDRYVSHPLNYYFRRVRPVTRTDSPDFATIDRYLFQPLEPRPMLLWDSAYQDFMKARTMMSGRRPASPPMIAFPDATLLLPGPYEQCSVPSVASSRGISD
jgi:hypothetical protein